MAYILSIETATEICSVSLLKNEDLVLHKLSNKTNNHANVLSDFIKQIFDETKISLNNIDAVAISEGPGSYTGLRIGFSTAKGLCYALDKPLIGISTLKGIALSIKQNISQIESENSLIFPMIDARRMEVYTSVYDYNLIEKVSPFSAIIEEDFFDSYNNNCFVGGNGSSKIKHLFENNDKIKFLSNIYTTSETIGKLAYKEFLDNNFLNLAYSEPFYLKEFEAKKSYIKGLFT